MNDLKEFLYTTKYINKYDRFEIITLFFELTEKQTEIQNIKSEVEDTKKQQLELLQKISGFSKDKAKENLNTNIVGKKMQENGRYMIIEKYRENSRLARSVWWDKEVNSERGTVHMRELFGDKVFNFPKPETLMTRIIEISTIYSTLT